MTIVLFHSADRLPNYLEYTFKQIRMFNPDVNVYFLTDTQHLSNPLFTQYYIKAVQMNKYHTDKISKFRLFYKHPSSSFWMITALRLIYVEEFMRQENLTNIYFFENDVLLYYSLKEHHQKFLDIYRKDSMAITEGGPDKCMTGFMFIPDWLLLAHMTQWFVDSLKRLGERGIMIKYKMDMVNEMTLMKAYMHEEEKLHNIPTMPFGIFYVASEFNSIFDSAGWGQFVGGTLDEGPGAKPQDHYIGQMLAKNPDFDVVWKRDTEQRNIPYFKFNGIEVKINNLHIHSKNLEKYVSK